MTDRPTQTARLDKAHGQVEALLSLLSARAREDLFAAVLPGQTYEPRVSGTATSAVDPADPDSESVALTSTERGVDRLTQAATYNRVCQQLEHVVAILTRLHDNVTPTGKACRSVARDPDNGQLVACERMAETDGYCGKCWPHVRWQGIPPDAKLLRDWNGRLERDCGCESSVCPHPPGRCENRIRPGVRARSCGSCRNRRTDPVWQDRSA